MSWLKLLPMPLMACHKIADVALAGPLLMWQPLRNMSAQEIIAELPRLSRPELEQVDAKLHQLLQSHSGTSGKSWGEALLEIAGTAEGVAPDFAHRHNHYLHGAP